MANKGKIGKSLGAIPPQVYLYVIGVPVVIGVAYFGIVKSLLQTLNIIDDAEDRKGKKAFSKLSNSQVLSPQLYLNNKSKVSISSSKANTLATQIYDGKWGGCGGFCDDEDKGVGAIQNAGSRVNISYIAYQFNILYGSSMETYLKDYLEPEDWITIENYISKIK